MQHYELIFIYPGTLTEDEVKPLVEGVKATVEKYGGKNLKMQDMGKSRLAYPMKHIRYGYFELCVFEADPASIPGMQHQIRLLPNMLRAAISRHDTRKKVITKINAVSDVLAGIEGEAIAPNEQRSMPERVISPEIVHAPKAIAPEMVATTAPAATKEPKVTKTLAEDIKLDDIDKKLDEILDADIANV